MGHLSKSRLLKNLSFVYLLQISNYLLAFLLTPYLARTLDVSGFGSYSYCLSVNAYLWMLIDWGYGTGAVREVALNREDPDKLRSVFWTILRGRFLLAIPATGLLMAFAVIGKANIPMIVIASGLLTIVGATLSCDWFVQGVERMGIYLFTSLAARIATVVLTLVLVRGPEDMWIAALLHGGIGIFGGVAGFVVVCLLYRMRYERGSLRISMRQILEFRHYFLLRTNALLYVLAAPVVLGIVSTASQLGLFAGADKIARIAATMVGPLSLVIAPRIFATMGSSRQAAARISGRFVAVQFMLTGSASIGLFVLAKPLAHIILGASYGGSVDIIRLLSPLPLVIGLSGALSNQFLVPLGHAKQLSRITLFTSLFYICALFALCYAFGANGAAGSLMLAEALMIVGCATILLLRERAYLSEALAGVTEIRLSSLFRR